MSAVFKPGLKEHFWAKDDGTAGTIDGMIMSMYSIIKRATPSVDTATPVKSKEEEIKEAEGMITQVVSSKLGNDTKEFVKYCSDHYRNKVANLDATQREAKKVLIISCMEKFDPMTKAVVAGLIFNREKLWGQKKRGVGTPKQAEPSEKRNLETLVQIVYTLFQAKDKAEKLAKEDVSWKDNKLKARKGTGKGVPAKYTMDDIRKDLRTRYPKVGF